MKNDHFCRCVSSNPGKEDRMVEFTGNHDKIHPIDASLDKRAGNATLLPV